MAPEPTTVDTVIVVARDPAIIADVDQALTGAAASPTIRRLQPTAAPDNVNVPAMPASDIAAVWMIATADRSGVADTIGRALDTPRRALVDVYQAHSTCQFDRGGDQVAPRRLAFLHRRSDIDHATFAERWSVHAGIVAEYQPSIASYTQHVIDNEDGGDGDGFDACAEFTFTAPVNGQAVSRHGSDAGRELLEADVAGFLGSAGSVSAWVLER